MDRIVDDLKKAIPLMEENYVSVKKNRFSPIAAKALLARVLSLYARMGFSDRTG